MTEYDPRTGKEITKKALDELVARDAAVDQVLEIHALVKAACGGASCDKQEVATLTLGVLAVLES